MARGLPRGGATRRVRVETLSEGISEGRVLLPRSTEAQTSHSWKDLALFHTVSLSAAARNSLPA